MPRRARISLCLLSFGAWSATAEAQVADRAEQSPDQDLGRLPPGLSTAVPSAAPNASLPDLLVTPDALVTDSSSPGPRIALQDAATTAAGRGGLPVSIPGLDGNGWQNRTSLAFENSWQLGKQVSLTVSDRLNVIEQNNVVFPSTRNVRNDLLEGYLTYQPWALNYLQIGRVNLRNGIALGFNPTDFFKTRTLIDQSSSDPSVIREDRLGSVVMRYQYIWGSGSVSLAFSPHLYNPPSLYNNDPDGLDPLLSNTNSVNRLLATFSCDLLDLSPQLLLFHDGNGERVGLNMSHPIGNNVIGYVEWAGGDQRNLLERAIEFGRQSGAFPENVPTILSNNPGIHFNNDLAVGASWASSFNLTINAEFHFHQSGFSGDDLRNYYRLGRLRNTLLSNELLYVRSYAEDQGEPLVRAQAFVRASWDDFVVKDLSVSAFTFIDLYDGSVFGQVSAAYNLSRSWTIEGFATANIGLGRSEYGSLPQQSSLTLQFTHYF